MRLALPLLLALVAISPLYAQTVETLVRDALAAIQKLDTAVTSLTTRVTTLENGTAKELAAIQTLLSNYGQQLSYENAGVKLRMTQLSKEVKAQTTQLAASQSCCQASAKQQVQLISAVLAEINNLKNAKTTLPPKGPGITSTVKEGCLALYNEGFTAPGAYNIRSHQLGVAKVWCDGGYTTLMRRSIGDLSFDKGFTSYVNGFGDVAGDHWTGLRTQHHLTKYRSAELIIEFFLDPDSIWNTKSFFTRFPTDNDGKLKYVRVGRFAVGPEDNYKLLLDQLSTNLQTNFTAEYVKRPSGSDFSARNRDRDGLDKQNCAAKYGGGFWDPCSAFLWPTVTKAPQAGYKCGPHNPVCARIYPYMVRSVHMKIHR